MYMGSFSTTGSASISGSATVSGTLTAGSLIASGISTFSGTLHTTSISVNTITISGLTSGEVPYATTGGELTGSSNLSFDGDNLLVNDLEGTMQVNFVDGGVINFGTIIGPGYAAVYDTVGSVYMGFDGNLEVDNDYTGERSFAVGSAFEYIPSYGGADYDQIVQVGDYRTTTFSTIFDVQNSSGSIFRVDSDNSNVGIHQTTPASGLSVNGNASIGSYSTTAAPTNGLIVSGSVGIGTSTPSTALQVVGSSTVQSLSATTVSISGNLSVTNSLSAVRVFPAGDLSMGTFSYSSLGNP